MNGLPASSFGYPQRQLAAIQSHPGFGAAMAAAARGSIEMYRASRIGNFILSDRMRSLVPYILFYLHNTGGLTPTRMKEFCVAMELCSRGRAEAALGLMRLAGVVEVSGSTEDRRLRRLLPTGKLTELIRERLELQYRALAHVLPDAQDLAQRLGDPDFEQSLLMRLSTKFVEGFRLLHSSPELLLFAERTAGMITLFSLMLAAEEGDTMPPERPVAAAIAQLSRQFSVSRTHILRLLRDAEENGLLKRVDARTGAVQFNEPLRNGLKNFFATVFLFFYDNGKAVLASSPARA